MRGLALTGIAVVAVVGIGVVALGSRQGEGASRSLAAAPTSSEQVLAEVAKDSIRSRLRNAPNLAFGNLEVVRFGPADERAVCGRVGTTDFILRILLPRDGSIPQNGHRYTTVLEQGPGLPVSASAAARYCRNAAEQPAEPVEAASPLTAQQAPASPVEAAPPIGAVLVRSPANIRAAPLGGSEVLRVAPQGTEYKVFSRAPGGWMQVGEAQPLGWIHSSLLTGANH
ncbi:SH3 domain-containing protein [Belnapia sp. T6]|uniref:SH3 domain-containing protein n=1 Tax=Belnapia mucosa TaxID=2804532 RepID=A0ABS1V695_9PROT|nr:SH3 domain-containing protein [Belnapia mucosa]MBL6457213.1 SH3 domain-containing protein [Belnapia mucosa]